MLRYVHKHGLCFVKSLVVVGFVERLEDASDR